MLLSLSVSSLSLPLENDSARTGPASAATARRFRGRWPRAIIIARRSHNVNSTLVATCAGACTCLVVCTRAEGMSCLQSALSGEVQNGAINYWLLQNHDANCEPSLCGAKTRNAACDWPGVRLHFFISNCGIASFLKVTLFAALQNTAVETSPRTINLTCELEREASHRHFCIEECSMPDIVGAS